MEFEALTWKNRRVCFWWRLSTIMHGFGSTLCARTCLQCFPRHPEFDRALHGRGGASNANRRWSRGDRDAGGGVLPARIDRCLVLAEPAPILRAYRRAEYAADRRDSFTGIGACLDRLIYKDATKPEDIR